MPVNAALDFVKESDKEIEHGRTTDNTDKIRHEEALLTPSYNILQILISLIQAIWAIITIYQAQGDQLQEYGYAAFGLTVIPYAFMSILNGFANLLSPTYPAIFLIRTRLLTELEQEGKCSFRAVLDVELSDCSASTLDEMNGFLKNQAAFYLNFVPLALVGGLSGFRGGNSTALQRGFTLSWLVVGTIYGSTLHMLGYTINTFKIVGRPFARFNYWRRRGCKLPLKWSRDLVFSKSEMDTTMNPYLENPMPDLSLFSQLALFSAPAFGGMVVVGMMLKEYGVCTRVG